ncbi:MAG TPA: hypothetical protein VFJ03_07775 [Candidatus Limnocylindria bacterium]|jgi:hypothetical protein|nr:hypothetical protein [Candidatus Limnocylindria bacterium]
MRTILAAGLVALLAACSTPVSSSPALPSASQALTSVPQPTPSAAATGSSEPSATASFTSLPGLSFDAALAWAEGFSLTCQTGLFPPNRNDQLVIALCQRQSPSDNAQTDLTIQYWPNNTVLAVSASTQPINGQEIASDFRIAWLQWMSGLPYAGADADATLDWLLSEAGCSDGCTKQFGSVSWARSVTAKAEAVSAFVPE